MNFEQQQLNRQLQKEQEKLDISKRSERSDSVINFLEKIKAFDFCQELNTNDHKKERIDFERFKSFLIRLNGIARDIPVGDRKLDGQSVQISGGLLNETILPPRQEDKEDLLKYAFDSAKELNSDDNSYMLPAVINSLHMFADGNGRTSRVVHLLLSFDNKESFNTELKKTLGVDGRFNTEDINPNHVNFEIEKYVLTDHGWYIDPETKKVLGPDKLKGGIASALYPNIDCTSTIGKNIEKFRKIAESDLYYLLAAVVENLSDEKYNSILLKDETRPKINGKLISPTNMQVLEEDDWKKIFDGYYGLKKEHICKLIDIFKNSENYYDSYDDSETLKDMFIRKIKEENRENNKVE